MLLGERREAVCRDGAGPPGDRLGLVEGRERVPGDRRLRKDRQLDAGVRGVENEALDPLEVAIDLTDLGIDLAGGDADAHGMDMSSASLSRNRWHPSSRARDRCPWPGPGAFILLGLSWPSWRAWPGWRPLVLPLERPARAPQSVRGRRAARARRAVGAVRTPPARRAI